MKTRWHVATAAEAFTAAQFARFGWDVSVQYGANQPEYDLIVANGDRLMKISVKGSRDGGWGLTQTFKKGRGYHDAVDAWLAKHAEKTVFCLVQFENVAVDELPRMYLTTPQEMADWLKKAAGGRGDTILYEKHRWSVQAQAYGTVDSIPASWAFTQERLEEIAGRLTISYRSPSDDQPRLGRGRQEETQR